MKSLAKLLAAVVLLALPGCGEKTPLPKGPPPEYEPARALPGAAIGDELPGAAAAPLPERLPQPPPIATTAPSAAVLPSAAPAASAPKTP
jgi:hypothetical protein